MFRFTKCWCLNVSAMLFWATLPFGLGVTESRSVLAQESVATESSLTADVDPSVAYPQPELQPKSEVQSVDSDFNQESLASEDRILNDIRVLASEEFEGRGIGTKGIDLAAEFIAEGFAQAGLDTTTINGGPFQTFEYPGGRGVTESSSLLISGVSKEEGLRLRLRDDFSVPGLSRSGEIPDAPLVFVGYGIHAPRLGYSDYEGIDVTGQVVVILRRNPFQNDPKGLFTVESGHSRFASLVTKVIEAKGRGAVGVIFVNDFYSTRQNRDQAVEAGRLDESEAVVDPLMVFEQTDGSLRDSIPCFHIHQRIANELFLLADGTSLEELESQIDVHKKPLSHRLKGVRVQGTVEIQNRQLQLKNVVGVLEAKGPLSHETIVLGAHYDHVGYGGNGSLMPSVRSVHYGADDNASGTAAIMEVARHLAAHRDQLKRRVVFVAFTAEESGLIGSEHFVKSELFRNNIVAMINLDMVGRLRDNFLVVYGVGTSPSWAGLIDKHASTTKLAVSMHSPGAGPSDQNAFFQNGVPVLHFFTGLHHEYHRPLDRWELLNIEGIARVSRLIEGLVTEVANLQSPLSFVNVSGYSSIDRSEKDLKFGTTAGYNGLGQGYLVQAVRQGSAAAQAGILPGDVIIQIGDQTITNLVDYEMTMRGYEFKQTAVMKIRRDGKTLQISATFREN